MKIRHFIRETLLLKPRVFWGNLALLTLTGFAESMSVVSLAPILDFYTAESDANTGVSRLLRSQLESFGIQPSIELYFLIFIGFIVMKSGLLFLSQVSILHFKYDVLGVVVKRATNQVFHSQWSFFTNLQQGLLMNAFSREIGAVGDLIGSVLRIFANSFRFMFYIGLAMYISWDLTLIAIGLAAVLLLPAKLIFKKSYRLGGLSTATAGNFQEFLMQCVSNAKFIISHSLQNSAMDKLNEKYKEHRKYTISSQTMDQGHILLNEPLVWAILISIIYISIEVIGYKITETAIVLYTLKTSLPLATGILVSWTGVKRSVPSYETIKKIEGDAGAMPLSVGSVNKTSFVNKISVESLKYCYSGSSEEVLKNISFDIFKGQYLAIVGPSGSGKSTLIDLVMNIQTPPQGSIKIDGMDIRDLDLGSYHKLIGYVSQENFLFNSSVRENMQWAKSDSTDTEIWDALKMANLKDEMQNADGLNTKVGTGGFKISGGQRQRLSLARAILRDPPILVLDEATSSLDSKSEFEIKDSIGKLIGNKTIISISHRLSSSIDADQILFLKEGRIVELGSFAELVESRGEFFDLARLQGLV